MWGHEDETVYSLYFLLFRQPPTKVPTMTFRDNRGGAATLARLETIGNGRDDRGAKIDRSAIDVVLGLAWRRLFTTPSIWLEDLAVRNSSGSIIPPMICGQLAPGHCQKLFDLVNTCMIYSASEQKRPCMPSRYLSAAMTSFAALHYTRLGVQQGPSKFLPPGMSKWAVLPSQSITQYLREFN